MPCFMRRPFSLALALLASSALVAQPVAAKDEAHIIKPSSAWVVDYKEESCRLMRQFGQGDDVVVAIFNHYAPGPYFQLTLAGKPVARNFGKTSGRVSLRFGPAEQAQQVEFLSGETGGLVAMIMPRAMTVAAREAEVPEEDEAAQESEARARPVPIVSPERMAAVRTLTVDRHMMKPVTLELGNMGKAFSALDTCIDDLLKKWAIDPVHYKTLSRYARALESPSEWLTTFDYPDKMLRERQGALVQFRLIVGADGIPRSCLIQESTYPEAFDDAVCGAVMKRARFAPALDGEGKAMDSVWQRSVRFRMRRPG